MNKSNLIGIVLIGVVIVVYSVFLLPKQTPASTPTSATDTTQVDTNTAVATAEEGQTTSDVAKPTPVDSLYAFSQLMSQPAKEYTLQNEKLCVTFTTQGAMPVSGSNLAGQSAQRLNAPDDAADRLVELSAHHLHDASRGLYARHGYRGARLRVALT